MAPGLFVTGTDTGVGKTVVSCALLRLALRAGHRLIPYKPVETGCPSPAAAADATALCRAAGSPVAVAEVTGATFAFPAAPAVAAAAAGTAVDVDSLAAHAGWLRERGDGLLVETAGGLLVPYHGAITAADLAARLALPILVVARSVLGTINQTALTVSEIRRRKLPLAGVILTETTPGGHDPALDSAAQIRAVTGIRPLGLLPFVPQHNPDRLADALLAALGPRTIADLLALSPNV